MFAAELSLSLPNPPGAVRTGGEQAVLVVVEAQVEHLVIMFQLVLLFSRQHVEDLDRCVRSRHENVLITFVEDRAVRGAEANIDLARFFDHPDVPNFVDTVGVSRNDHVAPQVELYSVDGVVVAVEGLDAEIGPDVPERHGLVASSGDEHAGVRLPLY